MVRAASALAVRRSSRGERFDFCGSIARGPCGTLIKSVVLRLKRPSATVFAEVWACCVRFKVLKAGGAVRVGLDASGVRKAIMIILGRDFTYGTPGGIALSINWHDLVTVFADEAGRVIAQSLVKPSRARRAGIVRRVARPLQVCSSRACCRQGEALCARGIFCDDTVVSYPYVAKPHTRHQLCPVG